MKNPDFIYEDVLDNNGNVIGYVLVSDPSAGIPKTTFLTNQQFRDFLTLSEKVAIKESSDTLVNILEDEMATGDKIDLASQDIIDLIENLVTVGIITAERKDEILAGVPL